MKLYIKKNRQSGQSMLMVTVLIGVVMATVAAVASTLTYYERRQVNDAEKSGMSIFAADAGLEKTLLCYFSKEGNASLNTICDFNGVSTIQLSNNASVTTDLECVDKDMNPLSCDNNFSVAGFLITASGFTKDSERIIETFFATKRNQGS